MDGGDTHARSARAGAMFAGGLNAAGMAVELLFTRHVAGAPVWPAIGSAVVGFLIVIVLWRARRASVGVSEVLFCVNALAIVTAMWFRDRAYAESELPWVPFQANKLGCLIVAFLAPTRRSGLIAIALHAGSSLLMFVLLTPQMRAHFELGEPTATIVFGGAGAALLEYRLRRQLLTRRLAEEQAEKIALAQLARSLLAVRDLASTPVQTIAFSSELIRRGPVPDLDRTLDRIDHAVARLAQLNELLSRYEAKLRTIESRGDAPSIDAAQVLERGAERI